MSDVVSLGARRAASTNEAEKVSPRDLLLRVIEEIDSGALSPSHVIVVSAMTEDDGGTHLQIDHAGNYDRFGQYGALTEAIRSMAEA